MPWWMRNCENLEKASYEGSGQFDIPKMRPVWIDHLEKVPFIGCNMAKGCDQPEKKGLHFFLEDYQFFRYWTGVDLYLPMLSRFRCVCTPDFSLYTDFPMAVQIYNTYRKHWLGAYWQEHGLDVIPTISWSDERSYSWCFDGDPIGGVVAVSSVGTQMNVVSRRLFRQGYEEMMQRLKPSLILFHGDVPAELPGNILPLPAYQTRLRKLSR